MKKQFILQDIKPGFENLDPIVQRLIIVSRTNIGNYCKIWITISDLDGQGWYVGSYRKSPFLGHAGQIYWKTECDWSGTYKNGKFYGENLSILGMLNQLRDNLEEFEFCKGILMNKFPKYVIKAILDRKVTSQEGVYKMIAHRSYRDKHWKIVRLCLQQCVSPMRLQMVCKDYEALLHSDVFDQRYEFFELIRYALITGTKVSCNWSSKRMDEEIKKMKRTVTSVEIEMKDDSPVYNLPDSMSFHVVNTEKEAFMVSEIFDNCVYNNYWYRIRTHKYFVAYNDKYCVGYQIIEDDNHDRDLLFDQAHTKHNGIVDNKTTTELDKLIRPILYELLKQIPTIPDPQTEIPLLF
jgi:hypothetical protein